MRYIIGARKPHNFATIVDVQITLTVRAEGTNTFVKHGQIYDCIRNFHAVTLVLDNEIIFRIISNSEIEADNRCKERFGLTDWHRKNSHFPRTFTKPIRHFRERPQETRLIYDFQKQAIEFAHPIDEETSAIESSNTF